MTLEQSRTKFCTTVRRDKARSEVWVNLSIFLSMDTWKTAARGGVQTVHCAWSIAAEWGWFTMCRNPFSLNPLTFEISQWFEKIQIIIISLSSHLGLDPLILRLQPLYDELLVLVLVDHDGGVGPVLVLVPGGDDLGEVELEGPPGGGAPKPLPSLTVATLDKLGVVTKIWRRPGVCYAAQLSVRITCNCFFLPWSATLCSAFWLWRLHGVEDFGKTNCKLIQIITNFTLSSCLTQ